MANIVIDPLIIIPPADDASREEVEAWLGHLTQWLNEALTAPFTWLHYMQASELLEANGQFPSFQRLKQLQQMHRLDISVPQLARRVNDFFRANTLDLKDHLRGLEYAIELEASSIVVEPAQFITRLPAYLHDDFYPLLADCCACKQLPHPFGQQLHIATLALTDGAREIVVSVVVLEALPDFARPTDNRIIQTIPLLITPDDLQPLTDVIELWAKGEHGIIYAIQQQYKKDQSSTGFPDNMLRLGAHFIKSVEQRGLDTNDVVLRSIIRAVSNVIADRARDIPGYRLHPFRKSETADSPQLIRESDQARAWRLMIQRSGAGWRLHYWQIPTPQGFEIELANICKESERDIY